jgi:glycerol-3-phosphate dehydrogenase
MEPIDRSRLGPAARARALDDLDNDQFDVVVIGAGVTGTGCALDAATRGLRVAMIEQRDLASGTSSRSSKLIHGGLRYLEQLNFRLVMEALRERGLLVRDLAPHLVRPVRFLYPLQHRVWERAYIGSGVLLYDVLAAMGRTNVLPYHRHLSRSGALERIPALKRDSLVGGIEYSDGQVDDARHTMFVARTAARLGATVAPSVRATGFIKDGSRITGVEAVCLETGRPLRIDARVVINATGVWTDRVEDLSGEDALRVTASKGIHIVVPKDRIESNAGMIIRTEKSVLFMVPWGRHWIIGTTDTEWNLDLAHPAASLTDIEYVLDHVNSVLDPPIGHDDIEGVYAGLRPLLSGETDATSKLSREHAVVETAPALVTVAGGKYTTYRVMAEDTIDFAARYLGGSIPKSATRITPLLGADGFQARMNARHRIASEYDVSADLVERLLWRYGSLVDDVLDLASQRPELGEVLPGTEDHLAAEVVYAATHEGALHLDDVLTRRTRVSIETWDRGLTAAAAAAPLMAEVLGWDEAAVERELAHYRARVEAEFESQRMPDDHTADAARLGAPDVRVGMRTSRDD